MAGGEKTKQTKLIKDAFRELMKGVCTSIPGHVLTFDPDTQLAQIQVGVIRVDLNGTESAVPPIIEVPVCFPGDDWFVEYQIDPGCEGDIFFSQRCVDGWLQTGGVAANPIGRFHNMQDAFFLPGFRSLANVMPDFQNNGIRLRDRAGTQFAWLKNNGDIAIENPIAFMRMNADGSMFWENANGHIRMAANGIVTINGVTITPASLVSTPNDVVAGTISLKNHRTSGVTSGVDISSVPVV